MIYYRQGHLDVSPDTVKGNDNNIFTFDIETSTALHDGDKLVSYYDVKKKYPNYKHRAKAIKEMLPCALCYIWQFGVNDKVYYGRYLNEFKQLLDELESKVDNPTIWVHNLSYEFQFLENIIAFDDVFARKPHKPLYAKWSNTTFRCSYMLTRLSLASWGENVGVEKKVGDLDYKIIRTPLTKLTEKELGYCEYDCLVMYYGLLKYREKYGTITNIPLTQTGEVRRVVKNMYKRNMNYHRKMTSLLPRNEDEYIWMKDCFAGGYTHANYIFANRLLKDVKSKDISSSYPFVMISERFPMSQWFFVPNYKIEEYIDNEDYSLMMDIELTDVESKTPMTYISISKCSNLVGETQDNGRVKKAKKLSLRCTNVDWEIIRKAYKIGKVKYKKVYASVNEYLDKELVDYILELYENKTSYKDVDGKEDIYMQSKQFINSMFGMMVTDIIMTNYYVSNGKWKMTETTIEDALEELRKKPYKNTFAYQHGVFITAYARRNLWDVILQMSNDVCYVDTDSVKYVGEHEDIFSNYNHRAMKKLEKAMEYFDIPMYRTRPKSPDGKAHQIGVYETETPYIEFKTMGAKRYVYLQNKKNKKTGEVKQEIGITISGVSKAKGAKALKKVDDICEDFLFDDEYTGKMLMVYDNDLPPVIWNLNQYDEYLSEYQYGISAIPTTYCMSMKDEYIDLITSYLCDYLVN